MAKNIEPKLMKIGDYLKLDRDMLFTIPEYQRAYSWGISNCEKLWQDILDFADNDARDSYFFGTIIISCEEDDTRYALIDGQQRTTTFLLLLKAMLMRVNIAINDTPNDADSAQLLRGLKARRQNIMQILYKASDEEISDIPSATEDPAIYGKPVIIKNTSMNELYKTDLEKILHAIDYDAAKATATEIKHKQGDNRLTNFFRNFKFFYNKLDELNVGQLNHFAKVFTEECEVIEIKSWKLDQAISMFNSLNSDGLPLYDSDIISAQLYGAADALGQTKAFKDVWEHVKETVEELDGMGITTLNGLLMQYMYYKRTVLGETVNERGIIDVTTPGLRKYYTSENTDLVRNPIETGDALKKLAVAWRKAADYPQMKVLLRFNDNFKLFLASYFLRFDNADDVSETAVQPVLDSLLRLFALLELGETGYSSKKYKTFLFGAEVKLADPSVPASEIEDLFTKHIQTYWNRAEVKNSLLAYDDYMLVYLNEYLFAKESGTVLELGSKYDVEHIMPNSGHNIPTIRADAGIADEDEFKSIVNKLGNKIVLESKINRGIGNEWFRTKVSTTLKDKTGYVDSKYPLAQALVNKYRGSAKPYWQKTDIENATEKASERIVKFIFAE